MKSTKVLIMAGGKGSRLGGDLPKVLRPVAGTPIIDRVLNAVSVVDDKPLVVVGHGAELVLEHLGDKVYPVWQEEQLGTGHAVMSAYEKVKELGVDELMVLPGDHPFVSSSVLTGLLNTHRADTGPVTMTGLKLSDLEGENSRFAGFGRLVRNQDDGELDYIVEVKDANENERGITEVNVGYYCFNTKWLFEALMQITNSNKSGEYYLTDVVAIARQAGKKVKCYTITDIYSAVGVNTPEELEKAELMTTTS